MATASGKVKVEVLVTHWACTDPNRPRRLERLEPGAQYEVDAARAEALIRGGRVKKVAK